jgi:nucleolin
MSIDAGKLQETILSLVSDEPRVKKLRKAVLLSLQLDEDDKAAKKAFKAAVQKLDEEGQISLSEDGVIKVKKRKSEGKDKKKSKKSKREDSKHVGEKVDADVDKQEEDNVSKSKSHDKTVHADNDNSNNNNNDKSAPCPGNTQGITRLFLGNLPFAVDETGLKEFMPGITHVKWITDKETGKFYGSAFVEVENSRLAAQAVNKAGEALMGRPVKVSYAPARPGDVWPPTDDNKQGGGNKKKQIETKMRDKPEGCTKLFVGNLSYDIDDDGISKFFDAVGAEVKAVRWLHHKDSGDFKGV